jgi:formate hydrogenlyase subunit 6/NADH:ubiquinone oxidoreductase subunit I
VVEGLVVETDTERIRKARAVVFELRLARSPDSERLKALAAEHGVTGTRIELDSDGGCILCGLCVRACAEVSERHAVSMAFRGPRRRVETPFGRMSERCIGCGSCAYVCPTGCITVEQAG